MYKSIIDIRFDALEKEVIRKIEQLDIKIDREELIRALKYDRNQYDAGYRDGKYEGWRKCMAAMESFVRTEGAKEVDD